MASSHGRCQHHHHHHHHNHHRHCVHCPLRRHCHHCPLHNNNLSHHNSLPFFNFTSPPPQIQNLSSLNQPISITSPHPPQQISQELEHIELDGDGEDDEPVFVLTDEWKEFFAKSEARRKLEKKQAKKGKK